MSNIVYYILLGIFIFSNSTASLILKAGSKKIPIGQGQPLVQTLMGMVTNWQLIAGIAFYGFSFFLSAIIYTKINISIAYPIMVGATIIMILIGSFFFFGEKVSLPQLLGVLLVITGITFISTGFKA